MQLARVALLAAALPALASACGFTIHMLVSHRAFSRFASTPLKPFLMDDLADNTGSLYAGSPYPDYLYACGSNHDNGEYTHWSPFQAVASRYVNTTYPAPRNATGRALVAFLAGITSHYMADESWHGINTPGGQGLIQTIGGLDFNATGQLDGNAHNFADDTGEFVAAYETFLTWDDPEQWVIPIPDLLAIYALAKRTDVKAADIEECAAIFFAGAEAVKAAAALAEPILVSDSPTFGESLFNQPVGGVDDMAVMAGRMWQRLGEWIDGAGPPSGDIHDRCLKEQRPRNRPWVAAEQRLLRALAGPVRAAGLVVESRHPDGRLSLARAPNKTPADFIGVVAEALRAMAGGAPLPRRAVAASGGWAAHDAAADDDAEDVAARFAEALLGARGAARADAAQVAAALDALTKPHSEREAARASLAAVGARAMLVPATPVFAAASANSLEYAGEALAVGDFGAGAPQLIVTAYGASPVGVYVDDVPTLPATRGNGSAVLSQAGGYYSRFSGDGGMLSDGPTPLGPEALTTSASAYARLGQAACVLDFNGDGVDDLVLGAPTAGWTFANSPQQEWPQYWYLGRVEIFFGAPGVGLPAPIAAPSAVILPLTNLSFLGSALSCRDDLSGDGRADLVIGSSNFQNYDASRGDDANVHSAGRVDVFFAGEAWAQAGEPAAPARIQISAANWTHVGTEHFQWTGFGLAALANATALGVTNEEAVRAALGARTNEPTSIARARVPARCAAVADMALAGDVAAPAVPAPALLVIGAPGFRAESATLGHQSAGRASGFILAAAGSAAGSLAACLRAAPVAIFSITADRTGLAQASMKSTKLGAGLALGFPLGRGAAPHLALGMPCVDLCGSSAIVGNGTSVFNTSAGAVAVLQLSPSTRGDVTWSAATAPGGAFGVRATLASRMPDARFGWRLAFADVLPGKATPADDLVVAAPQYSRFYFGDARGGAGAAPNPAPTPADDSGREVGALLVFRGGAAAFPVGASCAAETFASWWAEGPVAFGRMGTSFTLFDWDGDGAVELVVGAPRATLPISPQLGGGLRARPTEYAGLLLAYNRSAM